MIRTLRQTLGNNTDLVLVMAVMGILLVLFTPIPSQLLDFLLILNFCFALLILLLTFYAQKPVEFSTFPSMLLVATLFRLSLNIAATRLILSDADGGKVIGAIGSYVVAGNYVIGLIVFLILVVVQYVVVTSGAQRVAEVAARFTLDSMPGQQMSIDADLNMGLIDQVEAKRRRAQLQKEANFYGSMDGASKFVKGDAIAGIVILLINILGGLAIGVTQHGMSWQDAIQTYTLLTIGDGIVTQIPALVISVGTGIIITRSGSDARLSTEIFNQITAYPKTIFLVLFVLFALLLLPGIPIWPAFILGPAFALLGIWAQRSQKAKASTEKESEQESGEEDIYSLMRIEPLEVVIGHNLVSFITADDVLLMDKIAGFRKQYALEAGFVAPPLRIHDDKRLGGNVYEIRAFGTKISSGEIVPDRTLAIHSGGERRKLEGIETTDPTYGLPAVWVAEKERDAGRASGYTLVDPITVFLTHLGETVRRNAASLLTRAETERLLDRVRASQSTLVDEIVPAVLSAGEIQKVLQNLLKEKVSIRNLESILEVLADQGRQLKDPEALTEVVRQKLGLTICQGLANKEGDLFVITLDPAIEQTLAGSIKSFDDRTALVLEPKFMEQVITRIAQNVDKMMKKNVNPVLLCPPQLRRHIRSVTERVIPHLSVVSMSEVPNNVSLKAFGVVTI